MSSASGKSGVRVQLQSRIAAACAQLPRRILGIGLARRSRVLLKVALDPLPFLYEFTALLTVGLILGYARFATSSLWLPIGLHSGWIFSLRLFSQLTDRNELDPSLSLYIGDSLKEGLIPLATLGVTALLVHIHTRTLRPPRRPDPNSPAPTEPSTL